VYSMLERSFYLHLGSQTKKYGTKLVDNDLTRATNLARAFCNQDSETFLLSEAQPQKSRNDLCM
jgi:hypothetical protein